MRRYTDLTAERTNKDWIGLFVVDTRSPADCGSIPVPVHEHKAGPVLVSAEIVRAGLLFSSMSGVLSPSHPSSQHVGD